ncbi:MAG: hypothetical protein ACRETL_04455, partial [Gammaproteobacteria bacterium]
MDHVRLRPALASGLTSALLRKRTPPDSFLSYATLQHKPGDFGTVTAHRWDSMVGCPTAQTLSQSSGVRGEVVGHGI